MVGQTGGFGYSFLSPIANMKKNRLKTLTKKNFFFLQMQQVF